MATTIPFQDQADRERRRFPFVTLSLVALNVLVFLYQVSLLVQSPEALGEFTRAWGFVAAEIWSGQDRPPTIPVPVHVTLVTSMFLHGGLAHIAANVLFLVVFGDNVEDALGHGTFLLFYPASGVVAALVNVLMAGPIETPGIGASGAIAGVLVGYLVLFPRSEVRALLFFGPFVTVGRASALVLIAAWFLLQLGQGIASLGAPAQQGGVAHFAHVGGFVYGLVTVPLIRAARGQKVADITRARGVWLGRVFRNWVMLVVVTLGLLLGLAMALPDPLGRAARAGIVVVAAVAAVIDAWRRIHGQTTWLGSRTRAARISAYVQMVVALGALAGLVRAIT